eukprot:XP_001698093.1 predicted extracellular protein [Chlamydomonas reinhardtii]
MARSGRVRNAQLASHLLLATLCMGLRALPVGMAQPAEVEAALVGSDCPDRLPTCTTTVAAPRNMFCLRFSRDNNITVNLLKQYNPGIDCSLRIPEGFLDAGVTLARHNLYRTKHQAQPLAWSTRLQKEAQDWADNCWFEHSQTSYGENLALGHPSIEAAIDGWYSEVDKYDFSNPGFSSGTGQFTQLVWQRTYMVGCAIGVCPDGVSYAGGRWQGRVYVCMYWLPGNYPGQFAANVLPALEDASGRRRQQRRRAQQGIMQLQLHQHTSDDEL